MTYSIISYTYKQICEQRMYLFYSTFCLQVDEIKISSSVFFFPKCVDNKTYLLLLYKHWPNYTIVSLRMVCIGISNVDIRCEIRTFFFVLKLIFIGVNIFLPLKFYFYLKRCIFEVFPYKLSNNCWVPVLVTFELLINMIIRS